MTGWVGRRRTYAEDDDIMVVDCESRDSRLTDWERTFIDSLRKRIDEGRGLTPKQRDALNDIWDRVTLKN